MHTVSRLSPLAADARTQKRREPSARRRRHGRRGRRGGMHLTAAAAAPNAASSPPATRRAPPLPFLAEELIPACELQHEDDRSRDPNDRGPAAAGSMHNQAASATSRRHAPARASPSVVFRRVGQLNA